MTGMFPASPLGPLTPARVCPATSVVTPLSPTLVVTPTTVGLTVTVMRATVVRTTAVSGAVVTVRTVTCTTTLTNVIRHHDVRIQDILECAGAPRPSF